ncbi:hypothetical protein [Micromonospora sp. NPDC092111]|uniref:hypothetical protein n=1 Tax=Micromonospora sp. NPDC092111 TaxID=3364289 RepID=UPI00382680E9
MGSGRHVIALAGVSGALLIGVAAPAQAATPVARPASAAITAASSYLFGYYYTLEACRYFGDSLVRGGAWASYTCVYQWHPYDQQSYWYLYMS